MSVIANISTAVPAHQHEQKHLAAFMSDFLGHTLDEKRKTEILFNRSGIETRYSAIPDYSVGIEDRTFFPKTPDMEPFPPIEDRMKYFSEMAYPLCIDAIEKCVEGIIDVPEITHLITVSCTGMYAPGLDIDIVQHMHLRSDINRTSVNFMGCYAAIHALKQADYICKAEPGAVVMVVCVELCTIHFQKINNQDNITANLLFADGAAAALVVADDVAAAKKLKGFGIKKFHSQVALNGKGDMAWQLSSSGFLMTLSSYIPQLIEKGVKDLFEKILQQTELKQEDITHWAIHPGGRKILEVVQKELGLCDTALDSSYHVLKNYGNMSSPTILFVLKEIWDKKADKNRNELTYGAAFGPGLTMESVILANV